MVSRVVERVSFLQVSNKITRMSTKAMTDAFVYSFVGVGKFVNDFVRAHFMVFLWRRFNILACIMLVLW